MDTSLRYELGHLVEIQKMVVRCVVSYTLPRKCDGVKLGNVLQDCGVPIFVIC